LVRQVDGTQIGALATAAKSIGDVDRDGFGDYAIGAPFEDDPIIGTDCGVVRVYSGRTGAILAKWTGDSPNVTLGGPRADAIENVGDLNGDGFEDIAVGAPSWGRYDGTREYVRIYSGAYLHDPQLGPQVLATWSAPVECDFGFMIKRGGDINGDGQPDVLVS